MSAVSFLCPGPFVKWPWMCWSRYPRTSVWLAFDAPGEIQPNVIYKRVNALSPRGTPAFRNCQLQSIKWQSVKCWGHLMPDCRSKLSTVIQSHCWQWINKRVGESLFRVRVSFWPPAKLILQFLLSDMVFFANIRLSSIIFVVFKGPTDKCFPATSIRRDLLLYNGPRWPYFI